MDKKFWYGEYNFPQDLKDLYWGLPGTGILKILLDQFLQETGSDEGKKLQNNSYDDAAIFPWNKNNFSFALQFESDEKFNEWKGYREDFISWVDSTHDIKCVHSESGIVPNEYLSEKDSEHTVFWKSRKYFFEDLPEIRGFTPSNIMSGIAEIHSEKYPEDKS
jgi:hypothetical protein